MKKLLSKVTVLMSAVLLTVSCFTFPASAAGSTISFSNKSPQVNQAVTVSVTVNTEESMYAAQFTLNYDPAVLRFDSGDSASGGAGAVNVVSAPSGVKKQTYTLKFTAIAAGSCSVRVTNAMYATDVEKPLNGAAANIVVSDAKKANDASLKALSVSGGSLSPRFSASVTTYSVSVPFTVTECKVYATAADSSAKVEVSGKPAIAVGKTTRTVTVTAPGGAQKTYTINITRLTEEKKDEPSVPDVTAPAAGTAVIDNVEYSVAADISGITLPKGFKSATVDYKETKVAAAQDDEAIYTIYYLKSASEQAYTPYVLDEDGETFEKLKYVTIGENTYILADFPSDLTTEDCFETNVEIGGFNVKCYESNQPDMLDFCYVYCFFDNNYASYKYDKRENVLQRDPGFKLISADEIDQNSSGIVNRFKSLSTNAKVIVLCLLAAALIVLALLVLMIIKIVQFNRRRLPDYEDDIMFSGDFDNAFITDEQSEKEDNIIQK